MGENTLVQPTASAITHAPIGKVDLKERVILVAGTRFHKSRFDPGEGKG